MPEAAGPVTGRRLPLIAVQPQPPGDDVAGHVREAPVLRVSVGPEPGERLRGRDVKLDRQHPGGLIDLGAVHRQVRSLPVQAAPVTIVPVVVRAAEQHHGRHVGEDEQLTELPVRQRAGRAAVQADHPGADRPDGQRDGEDRPGAELAGRRGERGPPRADSASPRSAAMTGAAEASTSWHGPSPSIS